MEEFKSFEEFEEFMKKMRSNALRREDEVFPIPIVFRISMKIPIDFELLIGGIMYSQCFKS